MRITPRSPQDSSAGSVTTCPSEVVQVAPAGTLTTFIVRSVFGEEIQAVRRTARRGDSFTTSSVSTGRCQGL